MRGAAQAEQIAKQSPKPESPILHHKKQGNSIFPVFYYVLIYFLWFCSENKRRNRIFLKLKLQITDFIVLLN